MTKQEAIDLAGSQSKLARLLGVTRGAVFQWKALPQGRMYQLMVIRPEWFNRL
jgi:DNA-binding transcriptional regulator YdaS (Cro superfamily)